MSTAILVASGKGGTGKTSITAGVASCMATMGHRTLCIDLDIGLRNLDVSLAMTDCALMDFSDVMEGRCSLKRSAVSHPTIPNLHLLTAPLQYRPQTGAAAQWLELIEQARGQFDYIFLDAPAGLGLGFRMARMAADRGLIVTTNDANALRDATRCVDELEKLPTLHLVVNRVSPKLMRRQKTTIDEAMDQAGLPLLGVVPEDPSVTLAAAADKPLIVYTQDGAAKACYNISKRLLGQRTALMKIRRM